MSIVSVETHTDVRVVGCTYVFVSVTVMKSVMTLVTVAVWTEVITSVTVDVSVFSMVWVYNTNQSPM